ncbi:MAG: NAD(P)-binding protein, partial [Beijerinckiaceae bacterium]|nr:NAD(P)-binding protein [Beijerinckiaceae bacterium]
MKLSGYERALGMDRPISRRDFLNGIAIGTCASLAGFPLPAKTRPPGEFQGQTDQAFAMMHALRDGRFWDKAGTVEPVSEHYDLIIVGAGISGLAAAFLFKQQAGAGARILILDNCEDFGGHAKRNEFVASNGRRIIGYGGSESFQSPGFFSPAAAKLIADAGINLTKFETWFDRSWAKDRGLGEATFYSRDSFEADALVRTDGNAADWVPQAPLAPKAKADLIALINSPLDPLKGRSRAEKLAFLSETTYESFLLMTLGLHPQAAACFDDTTKAYFGAGTDAVSCLDARAIGNPGFDSMDLGDALDPALSPSGRLIQADPDPYIYHFPDGNASLARALVRGLIPAALPGASIEDLVLAEADYARLDRPENHVRVRLNAPCVKIGHAGERVEACYAAGGTLRAVSADRAILACWHRVIPLIAPELPAAQIAALNDQHKVPIIYANVLLRSWESLAKLGIDRFSAPRGAFEECRIDYPVSIGSYRFADRPDEPVLLHLSKTVLGARGQAPREQSRAGRQALTSFTFPEMEFQIRDLLSRALGPGGFDPARDIEA